MSLNPEKNRAPNGARHVAVLILDVDHFPQEYLAGGAALSGVAEIFRSSRHERKGFGSGLALRNRDVFVDDAQLSVVRPLENMRDSRVRVMLVERLF